MTCSWLILLMQGPLWPTLPRRSLWMPQPGGSERRHRQLHRLSLVIGPRGAQGVARALRGLADVLGGCRRGALVPGPGGRRGAQVAARALRVLADVLGSCRREAIVLVLVRGHDDGGVGHVCCLLLGCVSAGRVRETCRSGARCAERAAPPARAP